MQIFYLSFNGVTQKEIKQKKERVLKLSYQTH